MDKYTYKIADHYLPALVNGDHSGMTDAEDRELAQWIAEEFTGRGGNFIVSPTDEHDEFALDAVSGLYASVTVVDFIRMH